MNPIVLSLRRLSFLFVVLAVGCGGSDDHPPQEPAGARQAALGTGGTGSGGGGTSGALPSCDPFVRTGDNGDVRYQLTTRPGESSVRLRVKKNGGLFVDQMLPVSERVLPNGDSFYSFVDAAARYANGDQLSVQFSVQTTGLLCDVNRTAAWRSGTAYAAGARISYAGSIYECRQAHTAQTGWEPATTLALWQVPNSCRGAGWTANTSYKLLDRVSYQGKNYEIVQAHTSQVDWAPPNVPALWRVTSAAPNPPAQTGNVTVWKPGPTDNDWSAPFRYGQAAACQPVFDRDHDGKPDAQDPCPDDGDKTEIGLCGCNHPETNSDGDSLPDCLDECPNDPLKLVKGDCGCGSNVAPKGKACDDASSPGAFTCDGAGRCGTVVRPVWAKGAVQSFAYQDSIYLVVPSDKLTWADAVRLAPPGYQLARVDSEVENRLLSSWVSGFNAGSTWLDGHVTQPGVVVHTNLVGSGDPTFWNDAGIPKNVDRHFVSWAPGQPTTGSGCESLSAAGTWQLSSCGELRSVIYERSSLAAIAVVTATPISCAEFPGLSCNQQPPASLPCVDPPPLSAACQACLDAGGTAASCASACPAEAQCQDCQDKHADDPSLCRAVCPNLACDFCQNDHPNDPSACAGVCGQTKEQACAGSYGAFCQVQLPPGTSTPTPCTKQACADGSSNCEPKFTCPTGLTCGTFPGSSSSPECAACVPRAGHPEDCATACAVLVCGIIPKDARGEPVCAPLNSDSSSSCRETVSCNSSKEVGNPDPDGSQLAPLAPVTPYVSVPNLPEAAAPVVTQYPPEPSATAEQLNTPAHPWCHYDTETLPHRQVEETKSGGAGHQKALQFDIDPDVTFDYTLNPKALGQLDFGINAQARLAATARFDFASITGSVKILDAVLAAKADRCGYTTRDSKIELFQRDFLPPLLKKENLEYLLTDNRIEGCDAAFKAYEEVVNRVKKAMRDAQELLRQYHAALKDHQCLDVEKICNDLLGQAPVGFVKVDCTSDVRIEDVINLFILNYEKLLSSTLSVPDSLKRLPLKVTQASAPDLRLGSKNFLKVNGLGFSLDDLPKIEALPTLQDAGGLLSKFTLPDPPELADPAGCNNSAPTERETLFTKPFMLGPIPMLLEVESVLRYGLGGHIDYQFHPDQVAAAVLGLPTGNAAVADQNKNTNITVASVTAGATPCVSAGVGLFVGAGFKGYGFRATAGVDGLVTLGTVSAPANATASLNLAVEDETVSLKPQPGTPPLAIPSSPREIADELKGLWDGGELPIKQRRFRIGLGYKYDVSVAVNHILAGHLTAALQIKFWLFKKRWSKKLIDFGDGLDLGGPHRLMADDREFSWGTLEMPSPFVNFRYLDYLPADVFEGKVPLVDVPLSSLGNLDWDSPRLSGITLSRASLSRLGGLGSALAAKGFDLNALKLSDLASLGYRLDQLSGVPLSVDDLAALHVSAADLARLGIELPRLSTDHLDLAGISVAHLGALNLPTTRASQVKVDWRDLPDLGACLRLTNLPQLLRDAGLDLAHLTLPDIQKLGVEIEAFRCWPLTAQHVASLALTTAELKTLGVDVSGINLDMDGDPASILMRGVDLSGLSLASLATLGYDLSRLTSLPVSSQRLEQLTKALGLTDITTALAAVGVDPDHVHASDLVKLGGQLDAIAGTLSSDDLQLDASELIKVGLGAKLKDVTGKVFKCEKPVALDTSKVGKFFFDRQCVQCKPLFNSELPYKNGEQSCSTDADCCSPAHCLPNAALGTSVCSSCPAGGCLQDEDVWDVLDDFGRTVPGCTTSNAGHCAGSDSEELLIVKDLNDVAPISSFEAFILPRVERTGLFDDRGFVVSTSTGVKKQVTGDPICGGATVGTLREPVEITQLLTKIGTNKYQFKIRAEDVCGTSIGWAGIQIHYRIHH